ncbi:MAG: IS256 family transposase, partial [Thermoanaerobaculia bacterium]
MAGIEEFLQGLFTRERGLKELVQWLANQAMQQEVSEHVGAELHQRNDDRRGHRNGVKPRTLKTRVGELALSIPQVRGCEPYHPSLFARFERSERAMLVACGEMYFQGVSTRKVREVLEAMGAGEVSAMTVSRVAQEIDEKLAAFRSRRLDATEYPYLKVDARYEKVRVEGKVISQAVLTVIGFSSTGRREVLDWRVADSESAECWSGVMRSLKDRGLSGVKLVTSDAHRGIRAAIDRHLQGSAWQRCQVHYKREMCGKVSYKQSKELMADLRAVFGPRDKGECLRRGEEMAVKWDHRSEAVSKMLRESLEDCLTVLSFPADHQLRLCSTNMLENLMKRLKKRTRVVGIFPNPASCDRL